MGKLDGKVTIVTGASRGIGAEIAELFGREGAKVLCAARTVHEGDHKLEGSLDKTLAAVREAGGEAMPIAADVSRPEECEKLVQAALDGYGQIDVLVNNAALTYFIPIAEYALNRWMRSWAVNLHAPFLLSQLVIPHMAARKSGSIVNISSGAAIGPGRGPYEDMPPFIGGTCYGAEKAALERFTQGLAQEVYADGISVTAVSPSQVVPTPGTVHHKLVEGMDDPKGEPVALMAQAALLLATEPLEKVTGRVTYSQLILKEFGWLEGEVKGIGSGDAGTRAGSGYSLT